MQTDLFGNPVPEKSFEDEYIEYISSPKWKLKREQALLHSGYRCERCKNSVYSCKLEVHHKTYNNFKHEKSEDLEVVCSDCHKKADKERIDRVRIERLVRQSEALYSARLEGWGKKVYGEDWYLNDGIKEEFDQWLENKGYSD